MAKRYVDDEPRPYRVENFAKGYNSYTGSNALVDDNEIPQGQNVFLDNNGGVSKVKGSEKFTSTELSTGHSVYGLGWLRNTTYNKVVAVSNTSWYEISTGTPTALTGVVFSADKETDFCQAIDRLYGANGTNNLAYTTDGSTVTEVTANGNIGRWPVSYNRRIYMTNSANPDRIYYSNPYGIEMGKSGAETTVVYDTTYFGTFDTDLAQSIAGGNAKNAGFIVLLPGAGIEITCLRKDVIQGAEYLFIYTKNHGTWRIAYSATNSDKTIVHTIQQISTAIGCPAGRSVVTAGNDQWFFGRDNYYTLGEVAQYANLRVSPKAGRVQTELESIAYAGISKVSAAYYKNKIYIAYTAVSGTYNDRVLIYDMILNAWSAPRIGMNASCFLEWENSSGVRYLLWGSSKSTDSRIYYLTTNSDDSGTAISANFTTKAFDCKIPGVVKYFAFIDVFYSTVYGELSYEVLINEESSVTGTLSLGSSNEGGIGVGSQIMGTFQVGKELSDTATFASLKKNDHFRIPVGFAKGDSISVKFSNNNLGETFAINGLVIYFQAGSIYETN